MIYLQTPTDVLRRRLQERAPANPDAPGLDDDYIRELNEAYNHFFFHYTRHAAAGRRNLAVRSVLGRRGARRLLKQMHGMGKGTRYYVPRTR